MGSEYESDPLPVPADRGIAELARRQYGVFGRGQALEMGATKSSIQRRLATGRWVQLYPGAYIHEGSPRTWRQSLLGACLAVAHGAAGSYRAGAALWRLSGYEPALVEISVLREHGRTLDGVIVHRLRTFPAADVTRREGISVTKPARTIIDIASVEPPARVEEALDDAIRRRLVSLRELRRRVLETRNFGRPGIALLGELLSARPTASSVLESDFEKELLHMMRAWGFPEPIAQFEVRDQTGRLAGRVDFAYPQRRLAIEADGYKWHFGKRRWRRDLARGNELALLGWRVIHVTWEDLEERPDLIRRQIAAALEGGLRRSRDP